MRSMNQPQTALLTDPIRALATNLLEQSVDDRFKKNPDLGQASTSSAVASVKIAKYEEALKALARELACVKENERQKIAEQLHDGFGQDLLLAKMRLGQLLDRLPPQYKGCVKEIADIIGDLICHTRTVIHEIVPARSLRSRPKSCVAIVSGRDTNETRTYLYGQTRFDAKIIERGNPAYSFSGCARASLQCGETRPGLSSQYRYDT